MYLLEGNIGVGKSTFLTLLHRYCPEIRVILEPQENWTANMYGQSLLDSFYKDPHRWSYTIETLAMIFRIKDYLHIQRKQYPFCIVERSVYSGHYCFARNGYVQGFFNESEWSIYSEWVDFMVHRQCLPPKGFIYLQASPETCYQRVKKRKRESEALLSLEYMTQIGEWHEKFLIEKSGIANYLKQVPVLTIDGEGNVLTDKALLRRHISSVLDFLQKTQSDQSPLCYSSRTD